MIKDRGNKTIGTKVATVVPEGISFDGSTDYLSRASDLTGNVDSKTFTFSCWVYVGKYIGTSQISLFVIRGSGGTRFNVYTDGTGSNLNFIATNSAGTQILNAFSASDTIPQNTWLNIEISVDLANSSNRSVYINDKLLSMTWTIYTNDTINFADATTNIEIGVNNLIYYWYRGRLSNLFLDYTYRDLSIEANRRHFITADGKPADWATTTALNGILMLEMKDASTAHINDGTGGNMVQNGTLATADRGANQDNCVASEFDGVDDKLTLASIAGATNSKLLTFSCIFTSTATNNDVFQLYSGGSEVSYIYFGSTGGMSVVFDATGGTNVLAFTVPASSIGNERTHQISFSVDMANTTNRYVFLNGVNITSSVTWSTYTDALIHVASINATIGGDPALFGYNNGTIGELYFDTTYIDLATDNPFWDTDLNKPIPARTAMANLGSNPLICSPISADNPTANYGSGGAWTLNG